ncbi:hypothetical protein EIN_154210 [Entamoeba invadens IP1]|uniref:Uncharacterized protein n=1 Tax=Entamoeba invadens IP1 TaxID=370355 RepID=A0A0A1U8Y7_ENTIV|nr:hypothetical protein EIN_154210 [Entamoeba invadens IP1]ELP91364.1 hypothetical protein EIN_154210 [Entamoeba invadens IP1]|eukprot:XP_004258135.1 hypothetical protein EIN_154210 [Entamoeba invadens IP1]
MGSKQSSQSLNNSRSSGSDPTISPRRSCSPVQRACKKGCKLSRSETYIEQDKAFKYIERYTELMQRVNNFENKFVNQSYEKIIEEVGCIDEKSIELSEEFIHAHAVKKVFATVDYEKSQMYVRDLHLACIGREGNGCKFQENHDKIEVLLWKVKADKEIQLRNEYLKSIDDFGELYSGNANEKDLDAMFKKIENSVRMYLKAKELENEQLQSEQNYITRGFIQQFPNYRVPV